MSSFYSLIEERGKFFKRNTPLLIGILVIFIAYFYDGYYKKRVLSFTDSPALSKKTEGEVKKSFKPTKVKISSVGIDLAIEEGNIKDGVWQISENQATHLDVSKNPGDGGNVVIYAHNKGNLFGPLRKVKQGDEIKILNSNNQEFIYKVNQTITVTPQEIDYVLPKNEETLTLYTCTGFLDSKRFIVVAKPL